MKFTSEDLIKAMGLKVGDRVETVMGTIKATFEVRKDFTLLRLDNIPIHNARTGYELWDILGLEYKILPAPKRVGDLKCGTDIACSECPLKMITNHSCYSGKTLNEILNNVSEGSKSYNTFDQEIYDILKARLDRVVFERQDNMEVKE